MSKYELVWKAFKENEVSHSTAHYLMAIDSFREEGEFPRAVDLSRRLDVSRNAVSLQIRSLANNKFVKIGKDNRIHLTEFGEQTVKRIAGKRETMKTLLSEVLGLPEHIAEEDACKVEHLLSEETGMALAKLVNFLKSDKKAVRDFLQEFQKTFIRYKSRKREAHSEGIGLVEQSQKPVLKKDPRTGIKREE